MTRDHTSSGSLSRSNESPKDDVIDSDGDGTRPPPPAMVLEAVLAHVHLVARDGFFSRGVA